MMLYVLAKIALYRLRAWSAIERFATRRKKRAARQWFAYHGVKARRK